MVPNIFQLNIFLDTKSKTMEMVFKIINKEYAFFSIWKALQALLLNFFIL